MELLYKPDFEEARAHWEAFWNKEGEGGEVPKSEIRRRKDIYGTTLQTRF